MELNESRLKHLETVELKHGAHGEQELLERACVMEAVAWVAGEEWSDHPRCACPVISEFLRSWNDSLKDKSRTRLLRPLIPKLVGSRSTKAVEMKRGYMALDWLARVQTPAWLDLAGMKDHAQLCRGLGELCDEASAKASNQILVTARDAARDAAWDAASYAARDAASYAAMDAAWDAARDAACYAAWDAASDAAWDAAGYAACYAAGDAASDAARAAAGYAASYAAWDAARDAASDAARDAASDAARDAARAKLQPTVEVLQASALELVGRMLAVTE